MLQAGQADLIGLDLMARAGFDPRESVPLWQNMSAAGGSPPEFMSTHPSGDTRIKDLNKRMTAAVKLQQQANAAGDTAALADIERRALERNASHTDWICDERRMGLTDDALYMHCLPADIGDEVAPSVMDRFRGAVAEEANKKLYVIMALLAVAKVDDLASRLS